MVLLPELGALALALFCLALALAATLIVTGLIRAMGGVPVLGRVIGAVLSPVAHALAWAAGQLEQGVDAILGATFHTLAKVLEWTFDLYKEQAAALLQLAHLVGSGIYDVSGLRSLVHRLEKAWHGIEHGIKTLTREYHGIERRVKALEHRIGKGIGHDLRVEIKALKRTVHGIEKGVIPELRQGIQTAEGEVTQLENFIKAIPGTRYLDWAAGIVTAALGLEIWNLFRCPSLLNSAKNRGCGLWNGLEDVLALFFDALIFADLCKILPTAVGIFGEVEAPLTELISGAANAACAQIPVDWVEPNVAAGPLPPAQTLGQLAAG